MEETVATVLTDMEVRLIQGLAVLFFIGFLPLILFMVAREKLQKYAITHVLCEFITPHQTGFTKMLPEVGGLVQLPAATKQGIPKTFPVGTSATVTVGWPDYFPSIMKVIARKIIFHTNTWEPISRISEANPILDPVLRPEILTIIQNEAASSLVIKRAQEEAQQEGMARYPSRRLKISFTTLLMVACVGLLIYLVVWFVQHGEGLLAGLGVQ